MSLHVNDRLKRLGTLLALAAGPSLFLCASSEAFVVVMSFQQWSWMYQRKNTPKSHASVSKNDDFRHVDMRR